MFLHTAKSFGIVSQTACSECATKRYDMTQLGNGSAFPLALKGVNSPKTGPSLLSNISILIQFLSKPTPLARVRTASVKAFCLDGSEYLLREHLVRCPLRVNSSRRFHCVEFDDISTRSEHVLPLFQSIYHNNSSALPSNTWNL